MGNENFPSTLATSPPWTSPPLLPQKPHDRHVPAISRWPRPDSDFHQAPECSWPFFYISARARVGSCFGSPACILQHLCEAPLDIGPVILRREFRRRQF